MRGLAKHSVHGCGCRGIPQAGRKTLGEKVVHVWEQIRHGRRASHDRERPVREAGLLMWHVHGSRKWNATALFLPFDVQHSELGGEKRAFGLLFVTRNLVQFACDAQHWIQGMRAPVILERQ